MSARTTYLLLFLPALAMLALALYPFVQGVLTAFSDRKLYYDSSEFIGFRNFIDLFADDEFRDSIFRTLAFTAGVIFVQIPLGLGIALLLLGQSWFQPILRSTLVLPLLIPPVVAGLMWKTMMQPQSGILNWLLSNVGIPPQDVAFARRYGVALGHLDRHVGVHPIRRADPAGRVAVDTA